MSEFIVIPHNDDGYSFRLADDLSIASIQRYSDNGKPQPETLAWDDLDSKLQAEFNVRLRKLQGQPR
jgi:hypothetical protein